MIHSSFNQDSDCRDNKDMASKGMSDMRQKQEGMLGMTSVETQGEHFQIDFYMHSVYMFLHSY